MKIHGIEMTDDFFREFYKGTFAESFNVDVEITPDMKLIFPEGTSQKKINEVTDFFNGVLKILPDHEAGN